MFSKDQILEIQQKLASLGYKDTDFEVISADDMTSEDSIVVVNNGQNKRILLSMLQDFFMKTSGLVVKIIVGGEEYTAVDGVLQLPDFPTKLADLEEDPTHKHVAQSEKNTWNNKQPKISDLDEIREGATAGSKAYQKPAGGIPKSDLDASVQTSLTHANSALQELPEFKTINGEEIIGHGDIEIDVDTSGLMPIPEGTAENSIAVFDRDGKVKDGGYKLTQYYTKPDVDRAVNRVAMRVEALEGEFVDVTEEEYEELVKSGHVQEDVYYMISEDE